MPVLKHKTPCRECPWRKDSAPGWLGGQVPEWYTDRIRAEQPMACHLHFDSTTQSRPENEAIAGLPYCAGSLIVQRNMVKNPRDPKYSEAVRAVAKCDTVFAHPIKFLEHHE